MKQTLEDQRRMPAQPEVARTLVQERREDLYRRLLKGASGAEIVAAHTDIVDAVIIEPYQSVVRRARKYAVERLQQSCLVAVGGYGRRELAPYSDIDVMVLFDSRGEDGITNLSTQVFHHLWDLGFQVGHSVRSLHDCLVLAEEDLSARTSLMEARFLAGDSDVFQQFGKKFARRMLGHRTGRFIEQKIDERQREYAKFGETIYLLEPNIKKSKGGLRDFHLLQWVGMARYKALTIQELANRGYLTHQDYLALLEAREFLWRVRALMHLHAGKAQDILSFEEQVRLANQSGFSDEPHLLAVEQFMQQYYRHTMELHEQTVRFFARSRKVSFLGWFASRCSSRLVDGCYVVSGTSVTVLATKLACALDSPSLLLRLFQLAQTKKLTIESRLLGEIHRHVEGMSNEGFCTSEVSQMFRAILSSPSSVGNTLEAMHRARLLEKLIPAFARVRGLMQFNEFHKYTVDVHSLLAVKQAEALGQRPDTFGEVYQEIQHKDILHLAILLHDLGKGYAEDHSEVGKALAEETATRLELDQQEAETLEFLVHRHLLMAHTAFRRDPYDDKVLVTFSRTVGKPDVLRKLLMLTAADIAAVGPDMLTKWKESLLIELYRRAFPEVSGGRESSENPVDLKRVALEITRLTERHHNREREPRLGQVEGFTSSWTESQLKEFPLRYLSSTPLDRIAAHLSAITRLQPNEVIVESAFHEALGICEYTFVTSEDMIPGIFMNGSGAMAAKGLQVLDAQIITRNDGIVVDTFHVVDSDFHGQPPPERLANVKQTMVNVLKGEDSIKNLVVRNRRTTFGRQRPLSHSSTEVHVDNETSDHFTVIDVFADDRQGLLYVMARAIFDLGLSVHAARISTRSDQVVDVFYVTGAGGAKIEDTETCDAIRNMIKTKVDQFLRNSYLSCALKMRNEGL